MSLLADDDVIVHGNGERTRDRDVKVFGCRPLTSGAGCTGGRRPKA